MDMRRADFLMGRDESPLLLLLLVVLTEEEEEVGVGIVVRKKRGWGRKRGMRVQVGEERRMKRWAEDVVESGGTGWV